MRIEHGQRNSIVYGPGGEVLFRGSKSKSQELLIKMVVLNKEHYQRVASGLARQKPMHKASNKLLVWNDIVEEMITVFRTENPFFNEDKFRKTLQ